MKHLAIIKKTSQGIFLLGAGLLPAVQEFIDNSVQPINEQCYRIYDDDNRTIDNIARNLSVFGCEVRLINNEEKSEPRNIMIGDKIISNPKYKETI